MGRAKHDWYEAQKRGWTAPDTFVCRVCVGDHFLQTLVDENASENECSYCKERSNIPIAAPVEEIMRHVASAFFQHFSEPAEAGLPRDSGEWVFDDLITDTQDAMFSFDWECNDDLFQDVCDSFHNHAWFPCAGGHWLELQESERRKYAWSSFVETTKHKTRYFFLNSGNNTDNQDDYPPEIILKLIGDDLVKHNLLKEIEIGTELFRVREMKSDHFYEKFDEVGPPPPELASAGRMNPPGISYGYFAFTAETAALEVIGSPPTIFSLARFKVSKPLLAVDLTVIPLLPSIFDVEKKKERDSLLFLSEFVKSISKPIAKDGKQHIEYVPSQIVSEYIGQAVVSNDGRSVDAIVYESTLNPGGVNVVVFPSRSIFLSWKEMLSLHSVEKVKILNWNALNDFISDGYS